MGQAASKAAATEAVKASAKRRTSISQTIQLQQHRDHPVKTSASSSVFDSSSSGGGGNFAIPTTATTIRVQQHQADTARRIADAASSRSSSEDGQSTSFRRDGNNILTNDDIDDARHHQNLLELPPDLLKFLNDAGPVTRTVDKQLTSPRVYDSLAQDETMVREHARQANTRVRRRMPIVSSSSRRVGDHDGGDATAEEMEDGTTTERTTNFSTTSSSNQTSTTASSSFHNYLGVSRHDFFDLSIKLQGVPVDSPEWKKLIHDQYEDIVKKINLAKKGGTMDSSTTKGGFDQLRDMALLENCARYIGVPVLMKDTEGDIIGMWHDKAKEMKHSLGLKAVRKNSLQFVLLNEDMVRGDVQNS